MHIKAVDYIITTAVFVLFYYNVSGKENIYTLSLS